MVILWDGRGHNEGNGCEGDLEIWESLLVKRFLGEFSRRYGARYTSERYMLWFVRGGEGRGNLYDGLLIGFVSCRLVCAWMVVR